MTTSTATASAGAAATTSRVGFARGFLWGLRGMLSKEIRGRSRGFRPALVLTGYLLALTIGVAGFLALAAESNLVASPWLGLQLFSALAVGAVLLVAFITPSLTAGAISGERERQTLDLMLVTRASALGLVAGKLASSLIYVLFLLVASLPAFALVYVYGGIAVEYLALVLAIAAATAVAHASLGLLLSVVLRRTIVASVVGYLLVLVLVFGLPFVATASRVVRPMMGDMPLAVSVAGPRGYPYFEPGYYSEGGGPPPGYAYASPLVALSSVLPAGTGGSDLPMIGELLRFVVGGTEPINQPGEGLLRPTYLGSMDQQTGTWDTEQVWAPWLYYIGGSLAAAPLAVVLAALALTPRKPWRAALIRRSRPAAAPAEGAGGGDGGDAA